LRAQGGGCEGEQKGGEGTNVHWCDTTSDLAGILSRAYAMLPMSHGMSWLRLFCVDS
jgi:hypothetical protein